MSLADRRAKDAAMAANMQKDAFHSPKGVRNRKASRLRAFMAALSPGLVGTAAFRRRRQ